MNSQFSNFKMAVSLDMSWKQRAGIEIWILEGESAAKIYKIFRNVYGKAALNVSKEIDQ